MTKYFFSQPIRQWLIIICVASSILWVLNIFTFIMQDVHLRTMPSAKKTADDSWQTIDIAKKMTFRIPSMMELENNYPEYRKSYVESYVGMGLSINFAYMRDPCLGIKDIEKSEKIEKPLIKIANTEAIKVVWHQNTITTICIPNIGKENEGVWLSIFCPNCPTSAEASQTANYIIDSISLKN